MCVVKGIGHRVAAPPSGPIRDDKIALPVLETRWILSPILAPKIHFIKQKCHAIVSKPFPSYGQSIFRIEVLH